jgi:S1/P1 Nuclease
MQRNAPARPVVSFPSKWLALLTSFTVMLASVPCWGWGREGHQIVAAIAEDHLNETTRVMIQSLIGNNHLYSVATWADDVRKERHDTAPWHYVNIPLGGRYNDTRDCEPPRSCVVVKIEEFTRALTDKSKSRDERADVRVAPRGIVAHELRASGHARRPLGLSGFHGEGKQGAIGGGAAVGEASDRRVA